MDLLNNNNNVQADNQATSSSGTAASSASSATAAAAVVAGDAESDEDWGEKDFELIKTLLVVLHLLKFVYVCMCLRSKYHCPVFFVFLAQEVSWPSMWLHHSHRQRRL